jgi:hypothetical protein
MSRLPRRLQPAWPLVKRAHRVLTFLSGLVFRRLSRLFGARGLPHTATATSAETARREPGAVTVHPGGEPEQLTRGPAAGQPAGHWVFRRGEKARVPGRYTLEIRDGRLATPNGAAITPGGILDYQSSGYFGISGWREHPLFLRPTLGRVEHVEGTALSLTTRGTATNYYHFLYDAIGRLGVFEEALPGEHVDAVIVPHQTRYQRELLALAGVTAPLLQPRPGLVHRADRLLVPSTPNQDLDAPPWVVDWLRRRLPPTGRTPDLPRRLYLSRGRTPNTRRFVHEEELWPMLERRGFVVLDPGRLSVQEQIDVFHHAEVVVSPHGAALTNITFAQPGVRVLEMFSPKYVHLGLWTICEAIGGVHYRYLVGDGEQREGRPMTAPLDDIDIPPAAVITALDALLED